MSGSNAKIEWYLARDGQQHGPLSDPELRKFIELSHLLPTDLVWRAGFPEWKTASEVFPETRPAPPPPPAPAPTLDASEPTEVASAGDAEETAPEPSATEGASAHDDPAEGQDNERTELQQISRATRAPQSAEAGTSPDPRAGGPDPAARPYPAEPTTPHGVSGPAAGRSPDAQNFQQASPHQTPPYQDGGRPQGLREQLASQAGSAEPNLSERGQSERGQPDRGPSGHGPSGPGPAGARPTAPHSANTGPSGPAPSGAGPSPQPGGHPMHQGPGPMQGVDPRQRPYGMQPGQPGNMQGAGMPGAQGQAAVAPNDGIDDDDFYDDFEDEPRGRPYLAIAASLVFVAVIGAGGWFAYANQSLITKIINDLTKDQTQAGPAVVAAPSTPSRSAPPASAPTQTQAVVTPKAPAQRLSLLDSTFWKAIKAQDATWTGRQEEALGKLRSQGKSMDERIAFMVSAMVDWRRSQADRVMTSAPDNLRTLARSFVDNLQFLVTKDVQACYGFISKGELSPAVLPFYRDAAQAKVLGMQTVAIVAAARNDGGQPTQYLQPSPKDFNALAKLLLKRGWSEEDLKMFSDPTALSSASPDKVCKLVTEWFDTQLKMPPSDLQMRLLATSLQPVVRG